ncbi:hypothetical protein GCM10027610_036110 [Dactylosporangium cerinum]
MLELAVVCFYPVVGIPVRRGATPTERAHRGQPDTPAPRQGPLPAYATADEQAVSALVAGNVALWDEISAADPKPWKLEVYDAANRWAQYRGL